MEVGRRSVAGCDDAELVRRNDADAATLHLLKEASRLDVAHEKDALDRFNVGAGGDHVHSDGDSGIGRSDKWNR